MEVGGDHKERCCAGEGGGKVGWARKDGAGERGGLSAVASSFEMHSEAMNYCSSVKNTTEPQTQLFARAVR